MAETRHTDSSRCSCFFLYDRSKVQEEGDLTRAGICYYYPEHTPLDLQELVCGQLAGVSRCVSEISASPVRLLRLRRSKYAIRMRDDFLWLHTQEELAVAGLLISPTCRLSSSTTSSPASGPSTTHRHRMVTTQMSPELTMKVMVHETEALQPTGTEEAIQWEELISGHAHSSTGSDARCFWPSELHTLRRPLVDNSSVLQRVCRFAPAWRASQEKETTLPSHMTTPWPMRCFRLRARHQVKVSEQEQVDDVSAGYQNHSSSEDENLRDDEEKEEEGAGQESDVRERRSDGEEECVRGCEERDVVLEPMLLYEHRVRGLVLMLLVEPSFDTHPNAKQEVYHSSLASLNGLEAHLRTIPPPSEIPLSSPNMSGRSTGLQDRLFVKATALLHSHFSHEDMLQEAIIRSASCALYATRTPAQETFFVQQGAPARNSGIPNGQDSAFSLPSKARHRLLKHGVNLL
ncbi:hypothetical protein PHYPO_G00238540 [Pangasianodon hypophthalmus]|uniref:Uncharacterized protein n=1 Tax=Pangasianodon hypophthalmus TaxID=310915 RepID=A0A5N5NK17_PANHP|nr:hypothetical protein PHYPO_G00238540 [Pangasianodon hypophthalmus]